MDGLIPLINEEAEGCVWMHNTDQQQVGTGLWGLVCRCPTLQATASLSTISVGAGEQGSLGMTDKTKFIFALN